MNGTSGYRWFWSCVAALLLYFASAWLLGVKNPGFQYDEALLVRGAVHVLNSSDEPTFNHEPGSWMRIGGRSWPLMVLPYEAAIKDYVSLLPFAAFGPDYRIARVVGLVLGVLGIWGVGVLLRDHVGEAVASWSVLILAAHPAYLNMTLYDQGTVSQWMAAMGLMSIALSRFLGRPDSPRAFWLGLTIGLGVWMRANFLWLVVAVLAAAIVVFGRRVIVSRRQFAAALAGSVVGLAPLILYEILSHWETLRFLKIGRVPEGLVTLLPHRLTILAQTLLVDLQHRRVWNAPDLPLYVRWAVPAVFVTSLGFCLFSREKSAEAEWRRGFAITFVVLLAFLLTSRLNVADHHMATLIPLAVPIVVFGVRRWSARWVTVAIAVIYFGSAGWLDFTAGQGMRDTGGTGAWSSAIFAVRDHILDNLPGREVRVLDWGLQNNLFVLSGGQIHSREMFWTATEERTNEGRRWEDEVEAGNVYLLNAPENTNFPAAGNGLRRSLQAAEIPYRKVEFYERGGRPFAEIIEIPDDLQRDPRR